MERRNCSYALHFHGKRSEQMRKPQRNSAWEARLSVLWQGLRRSFALSHTALLSGRVQWKAASCNGNLYRAMESRSVQWKAAQRAMESRTACNGKPHSVQWKAAQRAMERWILQQDFTFTTSHFES